MGGNRGIERDLSAFDRFEGVDPAPRGVHFVAEDSVAGTGGQAKAAVNAGIGAVDQGLGHARYFALQLPRGGCFMTRFGWRSF